MTAINEVIQEIKNSSSFLISTHINPEGDALGSAIGLGLALRSIGKKAVVVNRDPVPRFLDCWIAGIWPGRPFLTPKISQPLASLILIII
jgi:bifunctional oligoribonuclease and PAP phosphatase NrnA